MVVKWLVNQLTSQLVSSYFNYLGAGDPRCKVAIVMGVTNPDADR